MEASSRLTIGLGGGGLGWECRTSSGALGIILPRSTKRKLDALEGGLEGTGEVLKGGNKTYYMSDEALGLHKREIITDTQKTLS